jgi:hypothetical protein
MLSIFRGLLTWDIHRYIYINHPFKLLIIFGQQIPQREIIHHVLNLLDLLIISIFPYPFQSSRIDEGGNGLRASARGCARRTYPVLDPVATPPQGVVLEVQNLKACMDVFHKAADAEGESVIAKSDGVTGEAGLHADGGRISTGGTLVTSSKGRGFESWAGEHEVVLGGARDVSDVRVRR